MRIMAIDYGDAHTGIAISDPTGLLAGFTTVIDAYRPEAVAERIAALAAEHGVEELVLGHPINMDGTRGESARKAEAFAERLRQETGLTVELWDERLTTASAIGFLNRTDTRGQKRKNVVDTVSAVIILEDYLSHRRRQKEQTR